MSCCPPSHYRPSVPAVPTYPSVPPFSNMRIAVDIRHLTHPQPSGVGLYTANLIRAMARLAPDDEFVLFASGSAATLARLPQISAPNIRTIRVAIPNRLLFALLSLPGGPTLESFLPMPVSAWLFPDANIIRTKLPYALTVHDLSHELFPEFLTFKTRLRNRFANLRNLTRGAAIILAVSHSTARDLILRYGLSADQITVTTLGVAPQFLPGKAPSDRNYQLGYGLSEPYILSLSTLEPRKNIDGLIEAYSAFRQKTGRNIRLAIGGAKGWKFRHILDAAAKSPYAADIIFLGYIHEKHKPALYRGASAFVFPSFYEGFGLPVLEAMACGTPVIAGNTSSLPELIEDSGILIDPMNTSDIALALEQLLTAPKAEVLYSMLKAKGLDRARHFHWDKTALTTLSAIRTLVE